MYINIKCKGRCYICDNPLQPYVKSNNWQVRDLVDFIKKIYHHYFVTIM